jgi:hypothetical protein
VTASSEYQLTCWRDIPSLVVARAGDSTVKTPLAARFQEAIDEAAMRLGETSSDAYLEGWVRSDWTPADGTPAEVTDRVVADLEAAWTAARLAAYLDALSSGQDGR